MTPEKDIESIVRSVCPDSGHWPYTRESDLFVGWKPAGDTIAQMAGNRIARMQVSYDLIVIGVKRGDMAQRMEALRFKLYAALRAGGWKLEAPPGPETYDDRQQRFLWPISVCKGFTLDEQGAPEDPKEGVKKHE
ncbi:MAG: hypothetical protein IKU38_08955 [Clostridia bacterium]|nr:hypothetical protein [Clostridia bacterium]